MIRTLPEIIDNAALKSPSNEAFKCGKVSFTFGQINQKMLQLAGYLQSLDVQKGDRVGTMYRVCYCRLWNHESRGSFCTLRSNSS
jgi:acyl-CoA synthetase (AMP-forming)/AMP-acid ligase II